MATLGNTVELQKKIIRLISNISEGDSLGVQDNKTLNELLDLDPAINQKFVLEQINKILEEVKESQNIKTYTELLTKFGEFLKTQSTIDNLSKNKDIASTIQAKLLEISKLINIPTVNEALASLQTFASAVISAAPSQFQPQLSSVLSDTVNGTRQFAQDVVTQGPQKALTSAFNSMKQVGQNAMRDVVSQAKNLVVAQAPSVITKALEIVNNFGDLKRVCEKVISSSDVYKQFVQLKEVGEQLQVLSKAGDKMVAAIEMGKNLQENLPIQCKFVTETLKSMVPDSLKTCLENIEKPLKPEIESVVKLLKDTGEQPFQLANGSLPEILEICKTCAKLQAQVKVNTEDPKIIEAVKQLGETMGVKFLPEEPTSRIKHGN